MMKVHGLCLMPIRAFFGLLLGTAVASASFLSEPYVKWMYTMPGAGMLGSRSLRKDNAVVVSKFGAVIFATADDGSLHIITPELDSAVVFEPDEETGAFTECRSGVSLYESEEEFFAVYAVVDIPITAGVPFDDRFSDYGTVTDVKSRIIAVNANGERRWSVTVNGYAIGTPVIGNDGDKIYVSTNVEAQDGSGNLNGGLRVIRDAGGVPYLTATKFLTDRSAPFGPLGIQTVLINGKNRDLVFFAESREDGFVNDGYVYFLTPSASYDESGGDGDDSYNLNTLSQWGKASVVRPTVGTDGLFLWMGGTGSAVAGWPDIEDMLDTADFARNFPVGPQWDTSISPSERNETQPLINAPVVSADNQFLYVNGASTELVCLKALDGTQVWVDNQGRSSYMSEPKLSATAAGTVLYTIEALSGNVRQHDASSGARNWEFDCRSISGIPSCQDSVEAEFDVSPDGNLLYYGDVFGHVIAMQVAEFSDPTLVPTGTPVAPTLVPTGTPVAPTLVPTSTPVAPTLVPTSTPVAPSLSPTVATAVTLTPTEASAIPSTTSPTFGDDFSKTIPPTGADTEPSKTSAPTVDGGAVTATRPPFITTGISGNEPAPSSSKDNNSLLISAIAVISFVVFAVVGLLFARKHRRNSAKKAAELQQEEADLRWEKDQKAWEESCREAELTTISEISSELPPKTPSSKRKSLRKPIPRTPATLASIEEGDDERSTATDKSKTKDPNADDKLEARDFVSPVKLDYRFAATTPSASGDEEQQANDTEGAGAVYSVTPVPSFDEDSATDGTATSLYIEDDSTASPLTAASREDIEISLRDANESPLSFIEDGNKGLTGSTDEDPIATSNGGANLDLPPMDEPGRILPKNDGTFDDPGRIPAVAASNALFVPVNGESRKSRSRSRSRSKSPISPRVSRLRASWNKSRARMKQQARSSKTQQGNQAGQLEHQVQSFDGSSVTSASDPFKDLVGPMSEEESALSTPNIRPTVRFSEEKQNDQDTKEKSASKTQSFFETSLNDIMETIASAENVFFKPANTQSDSSDVYESEATSKSTSNGGTNLNYTVPDDSSSSSFDSTDDDSIPPPPPPPLP